jgi:hypothetical protein
VNSEGGRKPALFLINKENMNDWIKQITENRLAVTLIVLIIGGMFGFYVNTMVSTGNYEIRIMVIETEIQALKLRQGQIEQVISMKQDRSSFDDCIRDLNTKMDRFNTETNQRFDKLFELILNKQQNP